MKTEIKHPAQLQQIQGKNISDFSLDCNWSYYFPKYVIYVFIFILVYKSFTILYFTAFK